MAVTAANCTLEVMVSTLIRRNWPRIRGNSTRQKRLHQPAPSSWADSMISAGIACRPAV